jgi:type VI protein secretion system component VasF
MAHANFQEFDKRMARILREHQKLSNGYVTKVTRDGLIVAKPRRRILSLAPLRFLLLLLVAAMVFKIFFYINMGAEVYNARVANLAVGTQVEKLGSFVLQADPVTVAIAEKLKAL